MLPNRRLLPLVPLLAALSLLAAGCSQLEKATGLPTPASGPDPATAFLLSLSADSVYLVDHVTGRLDPTAIGLVDPRAGGGSWSPGHKTIAYGDAGIFVVDPASDATPRRLVAGSGLSEPAWSPKGKSIAYTDGLRLWVTPVAKPKPVQILLPNTIAPAAPDWIGGPTILFEGVAMDCANPEGCLATEHSDLWTVNTDGSGLTQLTTSGDATHPKWSPDGSKILFIRTSSAKKFGSQLWVANPDGTVPRQLLTYKNVVAADWSADGTELVVVRLIATTQTLELWVGNADGTGLVQVGTSASKGAASVDW